MRYSRQLGLEGMVLYADDQLVGFTLGERIAPDMCSILIEKTDRQYVGSAQYIFSDFCRQNWHETTWTNVGDDWEIPSLAWTKQSYRPAMRLDKYVVRPARPCSVPVGSIEITMEVQQNDVPTIVAAEKCDATQPAETFDCNEAGLTDLDRLYAIEMACFAKPVAISKRQLRYLIRSPHASVHVLRSNGQIVAEALLLRRRNRNGHMTARLYSLAVDPACRGKGYGKTMLINCMNVLLAQGIVDLSLEVDVDNSTAIKLYESFGFSKAKRLKDYYAPGKDGWKMHLRMDSTQLQHRMATASSETSVQANS
jgi:ribosomal protein S18 acetylase RimI-like enzyme